MKDLLRELDEKLGNGDKAVCFWVTRKREAAAIRLHDGTEIGPFSYGEYWGPAADRDLSAKLAGRLYRAGLMSGAVSEEDAARMLRDSSMDGCVNQVFPSDFPEELRV